MGYQFRRSGDRDTRDGANRNSSKPNPSDGMVQYRDKEGMEVHFSANRGKCKRGVASFVQSSIEGGKEPMVGVYERHTFVKGGANTSMGAASTDIVHPYSMLIECLSECRMLDRAPISTSLTGNKPITKLIQVF